MSDWDEWEDYGDSMDAADAWLAENDPEASETPSEVYIDPELTSGGTASPTQISDMLLHRTTSMSTQVQLATLGLLSPGSVVLPKGIDRGKQIKDIELSREVLGNVIGSDIDPFVKGLKRSLEPVLSTFEENSKAPNIMDPTAYHTAVSMVTKTSEAYLQTGGTSTMAGKRTALQSTDSVPYDVTGARTQAEEDERFDTKVGYFKETSEELARAYFTEAGLRAPEAPRRVNMVKDALDRFAMDKVATQKIKLDAYGQPMFDNEGKPILTGAGIPTPHDLGIAKIAGVKPTMGENIKGDDNWGSNGWAGTPYGTVSAWEADRGNLEKKGMSPVEIARLRPSGENTIARGERRKELSKKWKSYRNQIREFTVTETDIGHGNRRRRPVLETTTSYASQEQAQRMEDINNAKLLDIELDEYSGAMLDPVTGESPVPDFGLISEFAEVTEQRMEGKGPLKVLAEDQGYVTGRNVPEDLLSNLRDKEKRSGLSDRESYIKNTLENPSPDQGTEEWLKQREGLITASKVTGIESAAEAESIAVKLAEEELGLDKFVGNAYTARGNLLEDAAVKKFRNATGLQVEEAFFETNPELPGFGVSPDGRVYDDEGNSQGLLEIKNVTDKGFLSGEQLDKYTDQMQLQMAVTGESKVHFVVRNADTGEISYDQVFEDVERQKELIEAGNAAHLIAKGVTGSVSPHTALAGVESTIKMKKKLRSQKGMKNANKNKVEKARVEAATYHPAEEEAPDAIVGFDKATSMAVANARTEEHIRLEGVYDKADKAFNKDIEDLAKAEIAAHKEDAKRTQAKEDSTRKMALTEIEAHKENEKRDAEAIEAANQEMANSMKDASNTVMEFSRSVKEASGVLGELANQARLGNESGMDVIERAASVGAKANKVRGVEDALEQGGLSSSNAKAVTSNVGAQLKSLRDLEKGASTYAEMEIKRAQSNVKSVRNADLASLDSLKGMEYEEYVSYAQSQIDAQDSVEGKAQMAEILNVPQLAASRADPDDLRTAEGNIKVDKQYDTKEGIAKGDQTARDARELASENLWGELIAGAGAVAAIGGSFTAAGGLKKIADLAGSNTKAGAATRAAGSSVKGAAGKVGSSIKGAAGKSVAQLGQSLKSASSFALDNAKKLPVGKIAKGGLIGAAPAAIRAIGGVEDDGGLADSVLDIADFTATGAAIGSMIAPGVGTLAGAAVGAGVGALNEAWQFFTNDETGEEIAATGKGNSEESPQQKSLRKAKERMIQSARGRSANIEAMSKEEGSYVSTVNGEITEQWEGGKNIIPNKDIDRSSAVSQQAAPKIENKVSVTNEISPDLITTTTDVNGDLQTQEEGVGTGG